MIISPLICLHISVWKYFSSKYLCFSCVHVYQAAVDKEDQSFPCVCVSPELNINDHLLVTPLMPPPHQSNLKSRINKDLYK